MRFSKIYIFGAQIESTGGGMVSSYFVKSHAPRGCPANTQVLTRHTTYNIQNVDANTTYDMLMLMSLSNLSMSNIPHPTLHHLPYLPFFVPVQNSANFICPTLVRC